MSRIPGLSSRLENPEARVTRFEAALRALLAIAVVPLLFACAGGGSGDGQGDSGSDAQRGDGLLMPVESAAQFVAAMSSAMQSPDEAPLESFDERSGVALDALPPSALAGDTAGSFSQTYTLEAEVDEYDIVKYDGEHLYVATATAPLCCFIDRPVDFIGAVREPLPVALDSGVDTTVTANVAADALFAPEYQPPEAQIRVLKTDVAQASAAEVASIKLSERGHVSGMYLHSDRLAVLATQQRYLPYGLHFRDALTWYRQQVSLDIYDVEGVADADTDHQPLHRVTVEGGLVESRRIGDTIYLITRHTPFDYWHYFPRPVFVAANATGSSGETSAQADALKQEDLIPEVTIGSFKRPLFDPMDCWVTNEEKNKYDFRGHPVLTSITAIPINDPQAMQTLCYNESTAGLYVSQKAVYLTELRYRYSHSVDETVVHKFALGGIKAEYRGSAAVPGHLWTGGQNDFRISEHNDMLRLVTTEWVNDAEDRTEHRLFVLRESLSENALEIVGQLPNELNPEPIGKPNEALHAVRFFGDRAYLVTALRIDPLYVVDLSNASDPMILGELEIPGFSEFLHPVSDTLLLALGQHGDFEGNLDARLKLELYDVSDPLNPYAHQPPLVIGEEGDYSYSEARNNRHAFTYLPHDASTDRLAMPVNITARNEEGQYSYSSSLQLFEVRGKENPALAKIAPVGEVVAQPEPENSAWWWHDGRRSVLHDDAVYYISGGHVWSAPWTDPGDVEGPQ